MEGIQRGYEYAGEVYSSYRKLGSAVGVDGALIRYRVNTGMTLEDAVNEGKSVHKVTVHGLTFKNKRELAQHYGIDYTKLGIKTVSAEDLKQYVEDELNRELVTYNGGVYGTLDELCIEKGICGAIVTQRMRAGWSLTKALNTRVQSVRNKVSYNYKGVKYKSQRTLAESIGVTTTMVTRLKTRLGIGSVEAVRLVDGFLENYGGNRPHRVANIPFAIYNGRWYGNIKELLESVGTTRESVSGYMRVRGIKEHTDALSLMREETHARWVEVSTGEVLGRVALQEKYKLNVETLAEKGIAEVRELRVYPNCTYKETEYCATPEADFKIYIREYLANKALNG